MSWRAPWCSPRALIEREQGSVRVYSVCEECRRKIEIPGGAYRGVSLRFLVYPRSLRASISRIARSTWLASQCTRPHWSHTANFSCVAYTNGGTRRATASRGTSLSNSLQKEQRVKARRCGSNG